ncbi:hypothetical protein HMPREF9004_1859 [Schaalia cardiffensis F0333]|uniref:Uncharacterized protein n=1 Tax=Schaalia cardiffensis F0333 TaxID=888050 RepID=N6X1M3_9ACTO|nr:hypothetical protein HMPREF9004_1859 [Schaalia cardiffensis F0333]
MSDKHEGRNRVLPIPALQASPSSESSMPELHRAQRWGRLV